MYWWLLLVFFIGGDSATNKSNAECDTIYLLHTVTAAVPNAIDLDVGYSSTELLAYGEIAAQYVNEDPNLLPGYQLNLIQVSSQSCLQTYLDIFKGMASSEYKCVFGIVGLYSYCETLTVAQNLGHSGFGFVQLSSSTSSIFKNVGNYQYLYRVVSSQKVYADAVVELVVSFNWTKFSISYDAGSFEQRTTSIELASKVKRMPGIKVLTNTPLLTQYSDRYSDIYAGLLSHESKVAVFMFTRWQAAGILCEWYRHNLLWPNFVHIYIEQSLLTLSSTNNTSCTRDQLIKAMEGAIFIRQRLSVDNNTILDSGKSYEAYRQDIKMINSVSGDISRLGNTLHDQVWAFALAMNRSLNSLSTNINLSFHEVIGKTPTIRNTLADELKIINFQGASSEINFGKLQESSTVIDIIQVKNATEVLIGAYMPEAGMITYEKSFNKNSVPSDSFETVIYPFPMWLEVLLVMMQVLLVSATLIIIVCHICWKERPEIKSTSIKISIVTLIGCLLVSITSVPRTISINVRLPETVKNTILCNGGFWLFYMGISIMAVSLYFRLMRIYIFFHSTHVINKYWSDCHVILYIAATCSITLVVLVVWAIVDPLRPVSKLTFVHQDILPHYSVYLCCYSRTMQVWFVALAAWVTLIFVNLIVLAVMTRHVPIKDFKDTKKVNVFVFSILVIFSLSFAVSRFLDAIDLSMMAQAVGWFMEFSVVILCHLLIFLPKFMPILQMRSSNSRRQKNYMVQTTDYVQGTTNTVL